MQIVYSSRRGSREIEHIGSAHSPAEVEVLKAAAQQRLHAGQDSLDFGDGQPGADVLPIRSKRAQCLWDALTSAYMAIGLERACGGDEVFRQLVLGRIIEPTSKADTLRVLGEVGITPASYATINRRLAGYATPAWRERIAGACAAHAHLGPATLVLYDVTTLYFETDEGDGFREPGFSKERRLEPQITVGLLTDASGFPLMVNAFEGNTAETRTMLPVIQAFMAAHQLAEVTVVADAGMLSEANLKAIEDAGLRFIVGQRIPEVPFVVRQWHKDHPDEQVADQQVFVQPWQMGTRDDPRRRTIYYQYRADRARRSIKGIDAQVAKAEKAIAGKTAVKRNRFVKLTGGKRSVNRELEAKARALAGYKGYITNIEHPTAEQVIGAYHQLWHVEKSFRMSKHDLRARPIYHHKRESIDAHLSVVFAALAVTHWLETATGVSTRKIVTTLRRYHTIQIQAGDHLITAADPLPAEAQDLITKINHAAGLAH